MLPPMALTDTKIKNAKAREKTYRLYDEHGVPCIKIEVAIKLVIWLSRCKRYSSSG